MCDLCRRRQLDVRLQRIDVWLKEGMGIRVKISPVYRQGSLEVTVLRACVQAVQIISAAQRDLLRRVWLLLETRRMDRLEVVMRELLFGLVMRSVVLTPVRVLPPRRTHDAMHCAMFKVLVFVAQLIRNQTALRAVDLCGIRLFLGRLDLCAQIHAMGCVQRHFLLPNHV